MIRVIVYYLSINEIDISKSKIYYRYYAFVPYDLGHINSYGHEVISIFGYDSNNKCYVSCKNELDLYNKIYKTENTKIPLKTRIINFIIEYLESKKG